MNLYDLNQAIIAKMPELTKERKEEAFQLIETFEMETAAMYYMLLNNDEHYYTVFIRNPVGVTNYHTLADGIFECASSIGKIKTVDKFIDETGTRIEIWINDKCYILFPYDFGVVTYGGYCG